MRNFDTLRSIVGPLTLIHERAGPNLLRWTRRGIFGLWLLKVLLDPLWRLAQMPREFFTPVGVLGLLPIGLVDELLTSRVLVALWVLTVLTLAASLFYRAFPLASGLATVSLTIYSCLVRGFGPAVHTDVVLLLAVYVLTLFTWADHAEARRARLNRIEPLQPLHAWCSFPLITIVTLLTLSYFLVGLNRTLSGGVRLFTGDTMEGWLVDASLRGYLYNTNIGWHLPQWPGAILCLRLGLPVITFFEITAPLCLISHRYRCLFIPTMLLFHLLSLAFMNIFFYEDMLLYLLLVDWSRSESRAHVQPSVGYL